MRISADSADPSYSRQSARAKVFFRGSERLGVITADEEQRYIVAYVFDEHGRIVADKAVPRTDVLYGDVRIEMPETSAEDSIGWA